VDINSNRWNAIRYAFYAPFYDLIGSLFSAQRCRSLALLDVPPGGKLLLVGAGTGLDLPYIPANVDVTATDLTPAMVDRMARRARRLGLAADIRVMDGQHLEFADCSFDAVALHLILAVIPDPVQCMRETVRVLRPGGRIAVFDKFLPDEASPSLLRRMVNPIARFLFSDLNRKAGEIIKCVPVSVIHMEPSFPGGLFKIMILQKN
jgi:phosphatidylethanolamine/phosphatidyl-N-methylethanolamine N-methyltransferase